MIDATQIIAPNGPLEPAPKEDSNVFAARVQGYLDRAYVDPRVADVTPTTTRDRMARALALYDGFMADWRRMVREPLTVNVAEKGSHGYSTKQIDAVKADADAQLAEFESLIVVVPNVPAVVQKVAVRTFVCW